MDKDRLLIVEDDPGISMLLSEVAQGIGYETSIFNGIDEVKKKYHFYDPSIILLDLGIPEHDGIEILRFLSESSSHASIIIISGHDEKIRATAFNLGISYGLDMLGHYQKPISVNELSNILEGVKRSSIVPNSENLARAVNEKSFILQYQPMISLENNQLCGFEALVRWKLNDKKTIGADVFMPLVEKNGLAQPITRIVVGMLFNQYAILKSLDVDIKFSIDLSNNALNEVLLTDEIVEIAEHFKVNPQNIAFELNETAVMSEPQLAMEILTRLRLKGFRVVLDDFGKGYSSLVELHRLPFNGMKMHKSFSSNLMKDSQAKKIVKSIIELGHSLDLKIVADGVDSKETYVQLKKLGCNIAQGDYLSKPLESGEILKWIKKNCDEKMSFKWI